MRRCCSFTFTAPQLKIQRCLVWFRFYFQILSFELNSLHILRLCFTHSVRSLQQVTRLSARTTATLLILCLTSDTADLSVMRPRLYFPDAKLKLSPSVFSMWKHVIHDLEELNTVRQTQSSHQSLRFSSCRLLWTFSSFSVCVCVLVEKSNTLKRK